MTVRTSAPRFAVLRLDLPAQAGWSELCWSAFDAAGQFLAHGKATPAGLPMHDALDVVVPARRLAAHQLNLPPRERKHLDALVAQAMDDRLLGDKADALTVPGAPAGATRTVWVCSRRWLEESLGRLDAAGLHADRVFPEYELLPATPADGASTPCLETADGTLFRCADGSVGLADSPANAAVLSAQPDLRPLADRHRLPSPRACTNLLDARLASHGKKRFDPRTLRRSAVLLAISAGVLLLGNVIHWRQLEAREKALQHEIRQTFASAYPGTPIIDPLLQWESKTRELSAANHGDALDAVLNLASRLNLPLHPRRIEARDGQVRITVSDSEAAQFKAQLDASGAPEASPAEAGLTRLQFRLAP